jgi:hypothetical protein
VAAREFLDVALFACNSIGVQWQSVDAVVTSLT